MIRRFETIPPETVALAVLTAASAGLLAGAWYFQLVLGFLPCKLCLEQRWPHYAALAVGVAALLGVLLASRGARRNRAPTLALGLLVLIFAISAGMGGYHAGVEWGWFLGPSDCGGAAAPLAGSTQDFMKQLQSTRVVSCTEAAWRFAGLSLAGWNAAASLALAGYAALAVRKAAQRA